jgi:hypothetical protein
METYTGKQSMELCKAMLDMTAQRALNHAGLMVREAVSCTPADDPLRPKVCALYDLIAQLELEYNARWRPLGQGLGLTAGKAREEGEL